MNDQPSDSMNGSGADQPAAPRAASGLSPRAALWIGVLAGGWAATLLVGAAIFFSDGNLMPLRKAAAEDNDGNGELPNPFGRGGGIEVPDPLDLLPDSSTVEPRRAVPSPGGGTSDSNRRAIALSASNGGGESLVYYFDTVAQRLLVYQYRGRLPSSDRPLKASDKGGLRLLAARQIDFDLRLQGYRDLSERTRGQLQSAFEATNRRPAKGKGFVPDKQVDLNSK